ncbi:uncharacterized protein LOC127727821 [Mytilus californianus]|uniref:uncharacterized protein LOC127727821 n=1 Tax=Mytilus californianus TaxID=6549 RepID=UPI002246AF25|nr:uncharacterized protein LOC127727821 [Mytilus californianus]
MDRFRSIFLCLFVTQTLGNFIKFRSGYEYLYHFNSDSVIKELDKFQTNAKISFTAIQDGHEFQEILLKIYAFSFKPGEHKSTRNNNDDLDFSNWFSFDITPHGEILRVYHPVYENIDVLTAKKGFVSLLAAKLHYGKENEQSSTEWSYKTEEFGNEGHHNATYSVVRTPTGIEFKKTRQSTPIPNAKGSHMKTLHFDHDLGTIHRVLVEEDFSSPQISPDFDPYHNMRKYKAVNDFNSMDYPTMSATNHGELKFLTRQTVKEIEFRPSEKVVNASLHATTYNKTAHSDKTIKELKEIIKDSVDCIRDEPEQGSRKVLTCFHELVEATGSLPNEELDNIAKGYFIVLKPVSKKNKESIEIMIDAFAVLSNDHVQGLLTNMIIRNPKPQENFIMRLVSHVSGYDSSPDESIINGMVDLCFHKDKFPEYLYTGDLYNRVLLALGSVVHKLAKCGQIERATDIIDKVHSMIGLHGKIFFFYKSINNFPKRNLLYMF